jgi:GntP family gluconate:H+ symporter
LSGLHPLIILGIGILIVLGMIIVLRINAFLALITAAVVVSMLSPGELSEKVDRVAMAFGMTAYKIGIVIAMAAVIGRCLIDSGAADRVVRMFLGLLGEKRCEVSLMASGFVLSIPVFFDTVFYLLLPLARSMHRRTKKSYILLILAMGAAGSLTHSLVPPTPGPLIIADTLGIDLGMMIMMGTVISLPIAVVMYFFVIFLSRRIEIPMRPIEGAEPEPEPLADENLPALLPSIAPIILPVVLISMHTIVSTLASGADAGSVLKRTEEITAVVGNANLAMMLSAAIAMIVLWRQRRMSGKKMSRIIEHSLMSGGMIILITSAGGAFGAMLKEAGVGDAIQNMFGGGQQTAGLRLLLLAFFVASLLKVAQGSTTVSMITTSAMFAGMISSGESLGLHPVYLAAAIGCGAQCGNWMNDSGFWVFAKMGGLTEVEALKTWTVTVSTMAVVGLVITIIFATVMPLV